MSNRTDINDTELQKALSDRRKRMSGMTLTASDRADKLADMVAGEVTPHTRGQALWSISRRMTAGIAASVASVALAAWAWIYAMSGRWDNEQELARTYETTETTVGRIIIAKPEPRETEAADKPVKTLRKTNDKETKTALNHHDRILAAIIDAETDEDRLSQRRIESPYQQMDEIMYASLDMPGEFTISQPESNEQYDHHTYKPEPYDE